MTTFKKVPTVQFSKLGGNDSPYLVLTFNDLVDVSTMDVTNAVNSKTDFVVTNLVGDSIALDLADSEAFKTIQTVEDIEGLAEIITDLVIHSELLEANESYASNIHERNQEITEYLQAKGINVDDIQSLLQKNNVTFDSTETRNEFLNNLKTYLTTRLFEQTVSKVYGKVSKAMSDDEKLSILVPYFDSEIQSEVLQVFKDMKELTGDSETFQTTLVSAVLRVYNDKMQEVLETSIFDKKLEILTELTENTSEVTVEDLEKLRVTDEEILTELTNHPEYVATIKQLGEMLNTTLDTVLASSVPNAVKLSAYLMKFPKPILEMYLNLLVKQSVANKQGLKIVTSVLNSVDILSKLGFDLELPKVVVAVEEEDEDEDLE